VSALFAKLKAFVKRPVVSHALAVALGLAATSLASGHVDPAAVLRAVSEVFAPAPAPAAPTPASAGAPSE